MRKIFKKASIAGILLVLTVTGLNAQDPTYLCELRNDVQIDARTFEFDVYLLRTGSTAFEYSSMQFGININSGARNGGTIAVSLISGSSELNASQIPPLSKFSFNATTNCIIMTGTAPPGAGAGTIISNTGNGTRVGRIRLTNTANFGTVTPDLNWSFLLANGYVTKVNAYVAGLSKEITVQASHTTSNLTNAILVSAPTAFAVTGGGSYCEGGAGVAVGLANSETGVTYTLFRGAVEVPPTVAGTGSAISFGLQTVAGAYTVEGSNAGGTTLMTGNATITVDPLPSVPLALAGSGADCSQITANWQSAANATSYRLDVSTSNTFATFVSGYQNWDVGSALTYNVTGLTAGTTYYYRVRGVNSCGTSANSGTITYATSPAAPVQPGAITGTTAQCPGVSGQIYSVAEVTNATSYAWSVPAFWTINSGQGTRTITVTTGGAGQGGDISVTASNSCGISAARTLTVTVGTLSTAPTGVTITSNNTCFGTTKTLSVTGGSLGTGAGWQWFTGSCGGTTAGTGTSITVNPGAGTSTIYYVRASGTCNTTTCTTGTVVVTTNVGTPTTPTPSASSICQGSAPAAYTTSAANATGFVWSVTGTGNTITGTSTTGTVTWSPTFSGVATVSVYATGCNGPSATASTTVTVRQTPTASISGTTTVCQNASSPYITFTNPQSLPVVITYNINLANEATINVAANNTATIAVPTTTAGTFAYNLVSVAYQAAPTCSNTASGTATVTISVTPAVTNQTASISSGGTFSVTPAGAPGGTTYTWTAPTYTGGVAGGVAQSTPQTIISGTLTISSGIGTAVYTVTPTAGSCVGPTFTLTVTVSSTCIPVTITTSPANTSMCAGGIASFTVVAGGTGPFAYQWQYYNGSTWASVANGTPAGASYATATSATLGVSGITAVGSYQYRCYVTNCSGGNNATSNAATLTVNAIPGTPTVSLTQTTCATGTGTITVTSPTGAGMTYSIDGSTYTNTTGIFTLVAPGTYPVTARSSAGCTSAGTSATINAQPPTPSVTNQTASISSGGTFTVTPTGVPTGTTYSWPIPTYTGGVTGGSAQTAQNNISGILTIPSGTGTATYTVTPAAGTCVGSAFTVTVTVNSTCTPVTITTSPANAGMCAGGSASFTVVAGGTGPFAYQWQYNGSSWASVANGTPAGASYATVTSATLGVSGITTTGSYQYRCYVTNCSGGNNINPMRPLLRSMHYQQPQ